MKREVASVAVKTPVPVATPRPEWPVLPKSGFVAKRSASKVADTVYIRMHKLHCGHILMMVPCQFICLTPLLHIAFGPGFFVRIWEILLVEAVCKPFVGRCQILIGSCCPRYRSVGA